MASQQNNKQSFEGPIIVPFNTAGLFFVALCEVAGLCS